MSIPDDVKQPLLRSFHIHTVTPGWAFSGSGPSEKDRQLLVEYNTIVEEVNLLLPEFVPPIYLAIISLTLSQIQGCHYRHLP